MTNVIDKLITALTQPNTNKSNADSKICQRITYDVYDIKKRILTEKLNHILSVLKSNHAAQLTDFVESLPITVNPLRALVKFRKMSYSRSHDLLFHYLIELSVLLDTLQSIEENVESVIDYVEVDY